MNSLHLKRPKRFDKEDEDELIAFQESFLKNQSNEQPAAKCIKKQQPIEADNIKKKANKCEINFESDDIALSLVMAEVIEKSHPDRCSINKSQLPVSNLPSIEKIDFKGLNQQTGQLKKKSLFAQNLEKKGQLNSFYNLENIYQINHLSKNEQINLLEKNIAKSKQNSKNGQEISPEVNMKRNKIVTGEGISSQKDAEQIHLENLERLSHLKPNEILEEQKKLMNQLDPKLLAFIRQKKFNEKNLTTNVGNMTSSDSKKKMSDEARQEFIDQLPVKPDKKWLNMDKIEYDKLEWMTKQKKETEVDVKGLPARFSFTGKLIDFNADVPVTESLHHHGNQPESAGYTLDELFHLARSKFNQQRVIALQTIANILAKCHTGEYDDSVKSGYGNENDKDEKNNDVHNLLNQLVDGGVLYLLRWSLDDQTESIINVSLVGLRNLLQPTDQEASLDAIFDLYKGHETFCFHPCLQAFNDLKSERSKQMFKLDKNMNVGEKKELEDLTDEEYIKYDLIKGLFRMNLIARLFYLLNTYKPSFTANKILKNIFSIIYRCVRHSTQIANEFIEKHSALIDLIVTRFMSEFIDPIANSPDDVVNTEMTIKLLRLIASAGVQSATRVFEKYELKNWLIRYLTSSQQLQTSLNFHSEVVRLLKVLTFLIPTKISGIIDFETILRNTTSSFQLLVKSSNMDTYEQITLYLQSMISLLNKLALENIGNIEMVEMCSGFFSIVQTFLLYKCEFYFKTNLTLLDLLNHNRIGGEYTSDLNLMSVCLNFMADYLENKYIDSEKRIEYIEHLISELYKPLLENKDFKLRLDNAIMSKLFGRSTATNDEIVLRYFSRIKGNNLSYLPTILNFEDSNGKIKNNMLTSIAPFGFMIGFLRLYLTCLKFRARSFETGGYASTYNFLSNEYLQSYLKAYGRSVSQKSDSLNNCFVIMKYENYFVYYYLKLASYLYNLEDSTLTEISTQKNDEEAEKVYNNIKNDKLSQKKLFYQAALALVLKFKSGDEYFLYDTLSTFIFNKNIWSIHLDSCSETKNLLVKYFNQLKLTNKQETIEFSPISTNVGDHELIKINTNVINGLEALIYENMNQIKLVYLKALLENKNLEHSRQLNSITDNNKHLRNLFLSTEYSNLFLLKADWIYTPISLYISLFRMSQSLNQKIDLETNHVISTVSNALKFIYILEVYCLEHIDTTLEITLRYVNLLYVYLFESEVFLDKEVITYLYLILLKYSKDPRVPLEKLNFNLQMPGLISFFDFYKHLLAHYDSTSFGDYLFSQFIIIPLQQIFPVKYRQLFWSEYFHLVKYICSDESCEALLPIRNFLEPCEKNLNMIRQYSQIILDQADSDFAIQSKFAYTILIGHLNTYIFEQTNINENKLEYDFKKLLVQRFVSIGNEKLKHDLINYKSYNYENNCQMFYSELPSQRKKWLNKLIG